jgi:threonyl-tRNA synthetase
MGKRFNLEYTDKDGSRKTPYIIHRAPLGTHERFIGFLIEHFAGNFPTWLSPIQIAIVPVRENHDEEAITLMKELKGRNIRAEIYPSGSNSLGKRIHEAKNMHTPHVIVLGDKEVSSKTLTVEHRNGTKTEGIGIEEFIKKVEDEITNKTLN